MRSLGPPLGVIVTRRIVLFAVLAMIAQLGIVFADYYRDDGGLGRLLIERETEAIAAGFGEGRRLAFSLPKALEARYAVSGDGYFARVRTASGTVLFSDCGDACADHLLPLAVDPPTFWMRRIAPGKPLSVAGGRTFRIAGTDVLVEIAVVRDQDGLMWGVLGHEVVDHMIVPMGLILVFVLGATLFSIRRALQPVHRAAAAADALEPERPGARPLDIAGMPREIGQLVAAVNRAFARVAELVRAQKVFTSAVAHEIRTPLAVIKLELERIEDPRARKAEADLDQLAAFVEQLTALARLEAIDHDAFVPVDLGRLTEETVGALAPFVYARRHRIAVAIEGTPLMLGMPGLIGDALRNLIENAVRHTPEGTAIRVGCGPAAVLCVIDDGPGGALPQNEAMPGTSKRAGGLGIGLEIVRRIAAIHGGRLDIGEAVPHGTAAVLHFPPLAGTVVET
ncbi:sensor histidine kinase [Prosthecomicrobium pneumaticum]|uniref:histidine kinase n=1 Tax=Prosthecomicrobium pneumaticum TaxID=81895 RepID=A0A7W9FNS3_9HYPH|nr:ATP-binding protein [Prosthecomicrobium pneumaticum]MBB5754052.1 signal transduction histidine kinase [Prosthecomicrobium pneumaticum]